MVSRGSDRDCCCNWLKCRELRQQVLALAPKDHPWRGSQLRLTPEGKYRAALCYSILYHLNASPEQEDFFIHPHHWTEAIYGLQKKRSALLTLMEAKDLDKDDGFKNRYCDNANSLVTIAPHLQDFTYKDSDLVKFVQAPINTVYEIESCLRKWQWDQHQEFEHNRFNQSQPILAVAYGEEYAPGAEIHSHSSVSASVDNRGLYEEAVRRSTRDLEAYCAPSFKSLPGPSMQVTTPTSVKQQSRYHITIPIIAVMGMILLSVFVGGILGIYVYTPLVGPKAENSSNTVTDAPAWTFPPASDSPATIIASSSKKTSSPQSSASASAPATSAPSLSQNSTDTEALPDPTNSTGMFNNATSAPTVGNGTVVHGDGNSNSTASSAWNASAPVVNGTTLTSNRTQTLSNSTAISNSTENDTITLIFSVIASLSDDRGSAILQEGTPQNLAFSAVKNESAAYNQSRLLQRYALRTLYYSTNGPNGWVNKTGWENDSENECLWYSHTISGNSNITCSNESVVHTLNLDENGLTGELPAEISLLTALTRISIRGVAGDPGLSGGIPSTLATLTRLSEIILQHHSFDKDIPIRLFDHWASVEELNIASCNLTGSIPNFSSLASVKKINLSGNHLKGSIPYDLSKVTDLEIFSVDQNQLTGPLPAKGLEYLSAMRSFSVAGNALTGAIPTQLGGMFKIQVLDLNMNMINGTIPSLLDELVDLQVLRLSHNSLSGPVPDFSAMTRLKEFGIEGNNLTGTISNATCASLTTANVISADCNSRGGGRVSCPCCTICCASSGKNCSSQGF